MTKTLRNIVIILLIAALVVFVPGGGTGASVVTQAVSLAFLASLAWFALIMYRQHRYSLYASATVAARCSTWPRAWPR